jgi:hypothetical protein
MARTRARLGLGLALSAAMVACSGVTAGSSGPVPDPANATFAIDRATVTLVNGRAEQDAAPGSAAKNVATLTDQRVNGDLDGDGKLDAVVIVTYQTGGSGTFYYVAALLSTAPTGAAGPSALLGDRIKVTAVRLDGRTIVVELLDRSAGQPFTSSPTVPIVRRFEVLQGVLVAR